MQLSEHACAVWQVPGPPRQQALQCLTEDPEKASGCFFVCGHRCLDSMYKVGKAQITGWPGGYTKQPPDEADHHKLRNKGAGGKGGCLP
jgi:hypothetical protein